MLISCNQGQLYPFDPPHAALLCVDFQSDFLSEKGMAAQRGLPFHELRRVIEPTRQVLAAARNMDMTIVHMRECYASDLPDLNPFRKARDSIIGSQGPLGRFLIRGESGTA